MFCFIGSCARWTFDVKRLPCIPIGSQLYKERGYTNVEVGEWGDGGRRTNRYTLPASSLANACPAEEIQTEMLVAEVYILLSLVTIS